VTQEQPATTNDAGVPVESDEHSLTVGPDGPILLQDHYLIEQMANFNRERIPERQPHAKGGGAFGHFEVTSDVSAFTKAAVFAPGTRTDTLIRFSTVAGERGSPDTWRDPRGFSLKFYTPEGNYDMVGNNTPVFFVKDPMKFQHFIRSQKRRADNNLRDHVSRMCLADTRLFMPGLNLTYTDRASMAASTEVRVPFVDPVVFSAAFSLPGQEKIRGRVQKAALKDAARAWIPREIIDRPKASFGAPLRAWVTNDLRELVDDVLIGGNLVSTGLLRREPLVRLIADQRSGRRDQSKQIWQLLTLELWYRNACAAGVGSC